MHKLTKAFENLGLGPNLLHPKHGDKISDDSQFEGDMGKKDSLDEAFKRRVDQAKREAYRLKDVFAAPLKMMADFAPPVYAKSKEEVAFIHSIMKEGIFYEHLSKGEQEMLIDAFELYTVPKGTVIIKQGDKGDYYYLVEAGTVSFSVDGFTVGTATQGKEFGELALLFDTPRAATCIAETQCKLFRLDQKTFRRIVAGYKIKGNDKLKALLKKVPFMENLDDATLSKIASSMDKCSFEKGEVIVRKGEEALAFYLIQDGSVKAIDLDLGGSKYDDLILGPGEHFGEDSIRGHHNFPGTAIAAEKTNLLYLRKEIFTRLFGNINALSARSYDSMLLVGCFGGRKRNEGAITLFLILTIVVIYSFFGYPDLMLKCETSKVGIPLPDDQQLARVDAESLASFVSEVEFKKGHNFFIEGKKTTPSLFLLRSGSVSVTSSKVGLGGFDWLGFALGLGETKMITRAGYFGNDTLSPDKKGLSVAKYTATAESDCIVGILRMDVFNFVLGKKETSKGEISLYDIQKHRVLGAGTFGQVWLVNKKGDNDAYALKVQNKRHLIENGQAEGVIEEKNIMARLDHPWAIIKLVNSYQDDLCVYMLTNLYQGGELQSIIHTKKRNGIPEWAARFYAAGILGGLSYMHHLNIIYRDLKPENVLLDSQGYPVIIDLGFGEPIFIEKPELHTGNGPPLSH